MKFRADDPYFTGKFQNGCRWVQRTSIAIQINRPIRYRSQSLGSLPQNGIRQRASQPVVSTGQQFGPFRFRTQGNARNLLKEGLFLHTPRISQNQGSRAFQPEYIKIAYGIHRSDPLRKRLKKFELFETRSGSGMKWQKDGKVASNFPKAAYQPFDDFSGINVLSPMQGTKGVLFFFQLETIQDMLSDFAFFSVKQSRVKHGATSPDYFFRWNPFCFKRLTASPVGANNKSQA